MKSISPTHIGVAVVIFSVLFWLFTEYQVREVEGSSTYGNDYNATTTYGGHPQTVRVLKASGGSLGSYIITGDNTGLVTFYNATTADATKRNAGLATSSLVIADFPASTPEGTYTFDVDATMGILMVTSGTPATGTVTYR